MAKFKLDTAEITRVNPKNSSKSVIYIEYQRIITLSKRLADILLINSSRPSRDIQKKAIDFQSKAVR